jgi:hypothetical protein
MNDAEDRAASLIAASVDEAKRPTAPNDLPGVTRWSTPGGYSLHNEYAFAGPVPEWCVWVAAAVGSGVLGNAAYDGLKALLVAVLSRKGRRERRPGDAELHESEALLLARLAVRIARIELQLPEPEFVEVDQVSFEGSEFRRCWDIYVHDDRNDYYFMLPDASPEQARLYGVMTRRVAAFE